MAANWVRTDFLGRGSYGSVFRAQCVSSHSSNSMKTVAEKSSLESRSWSLKLERAVLYELRGCKEIVRCFENEDFYSTEYDEKFYNIVLEYADGGTLGRLLKSRGGWLPEYEASWYASMLLKGLSHVHHKGLVHCDLKPDNILVFNVPSTEFKGVFKYDLKLADFGLAKMSEWVTRDAGREYKHRGTLLYSPPESVVFGVHEAAMDVWSLGCIVLEMLLGDGGLWSRCINAEGECVAEMIANFEDDNLSLLVPKFDCLSVNAKDFVRRCLAKHVAERWTADQLLEHPFITHSQKLLKTFEAQVLYKKMMKYQSSSSFRSSQISFGVR